LKKNISRNSNITFKIDQNKVENVINEVIDENDTNLYEDKFIHTNPNINQINKTSNYVTYMNNILKQNVNSSNKMTENSFDNNKSYLIKEQNQRCYNPKKHNTTVQYDNFTNYIFEHINKNKAPNDKIIQNIFSNSRNIKNIRRSNDIMNSKMFEDSLKNGIINKNTTNEAKIIQQLLIKDYKMDNKNNFYYTKSNNVKNLSFDIKAKNTNTNYLNELIQNEIKKKQKGNLIADNIETI